MDIKLKESQTKGVATAIINNVKVGEMTYSKTGNDFFIVDHTEVDSKFQGKDIGKKLLLYLVEMAREKKLKILPLCPFAAAMFKKIEEIKDVLKK